MGVCVSVAMVGVLVVGDRVGEAVVGDRVLGERLGEVVVGERVVGDMVGDLVVGERVDGACVRAPAPAEEGSDGVEAEWHLRSQKCRIRKHLRMMCVCLRGA